VSVFEDSENDAAGVRLGIYLHYKHRPEPGKVRLYNVVGVAQVSDNDAPGGLVVVYHGLQVEGHDAGLWWKTRKVDEFTGWVDPLFHEHPNYPVSSCRADHPEGLAGIWNWLAKYGLRQLVDDVTHLKPPAVAYVDDRAVACRPVGDPGEFQRVSLAIDLLAAGRHRGATTGAAS
jgi:hypothetical protein